MKNKMKWKAVQRTAGIIAIAAVIGFTAASCDDSGDGNVGDYDTVIGVDQLPEFPSGSTPAGTKAEAEAILAKLRQTHHVIDLINGERGEINDVVRENRPDGDNKWNFSFNNRSLPDGFVKVSASRSTNITNAGGFKKLYEDGEEENNIHFARGDRYSSTENINAKGELIKDKTEDGVTIVQGSIFEEKENLSINYTVSTAGNYATFRTNFTESYKWQRIYAFTVTTSSGSAKVILDSNEEFKGTGNNVLYRGDYDNSTETFTEKYSGSLKVYGNNNALLINHRIVDLASSKMADYLIDYDPHVFNPADAIPLSNNVKVNGNISSLLGANVVLYSINVTGGTKYHLWWDDSRTSGGGNGSTYVDEVRGYSNGNVFFVTTANFNLDWENYHSFTAASTGTVYIMVYSYNSGTFSIVYNTTGSKPAMSVSAAPPGANFRSMQNLSESVVIPKKALGVLRYNKR